MFINPAEAERLLLIISAMVNADCESGPEPISMFEFGYLVGNAALIQSTDIFNGDMKNLTEMQVDLAQGLNAGINQFSENRGALMDKSHSAYASLN
jgi:hypothetical protein